MYITYDTKTNIGEVNGHHIAQKPTFSFSYVWFLLTDETAQYLESYEGKTANKEMDEAQKAEIKAFVNSYTPPPPPTLTPQELLEQKKQEFVSALDLHVQQQIDTYNQAKGTVFENVKSCALYATQAKQRPHDPFCQWIWEYKDDVFDYAGNELVKIQQGKRAMPSTTEELLAEIEAKYPIQTQTFIGN